ncbi:MAG: glycoside hydrolase family 57 protein [Bacteroidales bacterium]|jgi:alpha-amylase|nr:glycoside hydrolase family 57 protein [Bacteroidales bacterium]
MKKSVCIYFQVHQPDRLKRYRFFDIGNDGYYFDDFANRTIIRRVANRCYIPANKLLLKMIKENGGDFKVAFSISGVVLEQFEKYVPEVIDSFKELAATGCVEFLAETYGHSLAAMISPMEFGKQVKEHCDAIKGYFGQKPTAFRNTELIYSDSIGAAVADMGFTTMLTEGAKHILGWKSPNFEYTNAINPKLKVLLRNFNLSDDIAFRFSNRSWASWPLTADKFAAWLEQALETEGDMVNLFMDYETFGEHQNQASGIFDFLYALPAAVLKGGDLEFCTPSEVAEKHQPIAPLHVPFPISWADEERDTSAWLGNELQNEAFHKLYDIEKKVYETKDAGLIDIFRKLQESDHFYYMCTKFFSDGAVHNYFNPYNSPYEAFINYMNVFSDFEIRINDKIKNVEKKKKTIKSKSKVSKTQPQKAK